MAKLSHSLMKSLFRGYIPEEMAFPFPVPDSDEADMVRILTDTLDQWARENFDSAKADSESQYPDGTFEALGEMGMFGLNIPEEFGGLDLSQTAYAKVFEHIATIDGSLPVSIGGHSSIGMKALLLFGSDEQKKKYLPALATGESIAAFALTEPGAGSDAASIATRAVRQADGSWVLNGQKMWITNGGSAQFFTVLAKTEVDVDGEKRDKISAFIVEGDRAGFTRGSEEHKLGIKASSTVPLYFDNVVLPAEALLGELGKGFKVAMHVLNSGRLGLAAGVVGGAKAMLREAMAHTRERRQFDQHLEEFELIKSKIAESTAQIYAAESMIYLTTALVDRGDVDYSIESAICKVYASEASWQIVNECLQMMGGLGYMQDYPFERALRDCRINMIFEGTNEILRLYIALAGFQEPGEYLRQIGRALRTPIKKFGLISEYAYTRVKEAVATPRITLYHPAVKRYADYLTRGTERFHKAVDSAIMKFGKRVVDRELMLARFADTAIDLYGLLAVVSRVSRQVEERGEAEARPELDIARIYCESANRRIKLNLRRIRRHDDSAIRRLAAHMSSQQRYDFAD